METGGSLIYALGAMALVVSALAARRLSFGETAKMILAWVAIFGVLFVIFSYMGAGNIRYRRNSEPECRWPKCAVNTR